MPHVNDVTLSTEAGAILIAEATSYDASGGEHQRWTDLEVWHRPGLSPRFVAQAVGASSYPGETDRERRLGGSSLAKVLRLFEGIDGAEPTPLGKVVIALAQDWERGQGFMGSTVTAALHWLYQGMDLGESPATRAARDFETTARPWQKALAAEKADRGSVASVTVPLIAIMPFLDRERFQEASAIRAATASAIKDGVVAGIGQAVDR